MTTKTLSRLWSEARRLDAYMYDQVVIQGRRAPELAEEFGITRVRVWQRIDRHRERHGLPPHGRPPGTRSAITLSQQAEIRERHRAGETYEQIAEALDLEPGPVGRAARGDTRQFADGVN